MQQALFPGDSELQQLLHIFKFLGTPDENVWPGVSKLRDWHEFPNWKAQEMTRAFNNLEPAGIELMKGMFTFDPVKRMSVSNLCTVWCRCWQAGMTRELATARLCQVAICCKACVSQVLYYGVASTFQP